MWVLVLGVQCVGVGVWECNVWVLVRESAMCGCWCVEVQCVGVGVGVQSVGVGALVCNVWVLVLVLVCHADSPPPPSHPHPLSQCVDSKRIRVCIQNVSVCTRRVAGTHGDVLNANEEGRQQHEPDSLSECLHLIYTNTYA